MSSQKQEIYKEENIVDNVILPGDSSELPDDFFRVIVFIDGSNLYHNLKRHNFKIDFNEFFKIFSKYGVVGKIFYYTSRLDKAFDEKRYLKHERFLEKIQKINNFNVVLCNLRKIVLKDGSFEFMIKGDDIYLAVDMIKGAFKNRYDVAVVVSGDEDFIPVIKAVQEIGKYVVNAYFPKSSSYLLRKCCDESVNLKKELNEKSQAENREGQLLK